MREVEESDNDRTYKEISIRWNIGKRKIRMF